MKKINFLLLIILARNAMAQGNSVISDYMKDEKSVQFRIGLTVYKNYSQSNISTNACGFLGKLYMYHDLVCYLIFAFISSVYLAPNSTLIGK
jgi:hypothetical protein